MGKAVVRAEFAIPGMLAQLRSFDFKDGYSEMVCEEQHVLSFKLSPTSPSAEGRFAGHRCGGDFGGIGDLLLIPGQVPLDSRVPSGGSLKTIYCRLERDGFNSLSGHGDDWTAPELAVCLDVRDSFIKEAMRRLAAEIVSPSFASNTLADALRVAISLEIAHYLSRRPLQETRSVGALSPIHLRKVRELIEDLRGGTPTLADMADRCGISPRHFTRLFRQATGESVLEFVNARRIERAKSYLADGKLAPKEIAYQLGFGDASSFSRAFRATTGETPIGYRNRVGTGASSILDEGHTRH